MLFWEVILYIKHGFIMLASLFIFAFSSLESCLIWSFDETYI